MAQTQGQFGGELAVLRHLTLNLLEREKSCKRSLAGKRLLADWDERYMEKVLFGR